MKMKNRLSRCLWFSWLLWVVGLVFIAGPHWRGGWGVLIVAVVLSAWLIIVPVVYGENMFNRRANSRGPGEAAVTSVVEDAVDKTPASPVIPDVMNASVRRCTLLAAGTEITGDVIITGDCQVCGHITGSVILHEGVLRVMKGGRIDGDVTAPAVSLDGSICGTCDADMVDILENGLLDGLCRSRQFSIVAGGVFTGQSERRAEPTVTDKDAGKTMSGTVTDLPARRTRHASPAAAVDSDNGVLADE